MMMDNPTTSQVRTLYLVGEDAQGHEVLRELLARPFEPDTNKGKRLGHPLILSIVVIEQTGEIRAIVLTKDKWWML